MFMSDSTPSAERTRKSQLRRETSDSSAAKQARTVASTRSRASRVGTWPAVSQARTESASQAAALGASQGASTGTFLAMAFMRAMAWAALEQRHRAHPRDVAPVAAHLPAGGEHVVAGDERREGGDAHLLGQRVHAVMVRADEAGPHVDGDAVAAGLRPHPAPDPVPRLEHHHRAPGLAEAPGRRQAGQSRADDADVGLPVVLAPALAVGHGTSSVGATANMRAARM